MSNLQRNCQVVLQSSCTILLSHRQCIKVPVSPHPCPHLIPVFLTIAVLMGVKCYVTVICISLMANGIEHLFNQCACWTLVCFFVKKLIQILWTFFQLGYFLFLIELKSLLGIFRRTPYGSQILAGATFGRNWMFCLMKTKIKCMQMYSRKFSRYFYMALVSIIKILGVQCGRGKYLWLTLMVFVFFSM